MAKNSINSATATNYARALLELANAQSQADQVRGELAGIREALDADPAFGAFLSNPAISSASRGQTLVRALEGKVSSLVLNFVRLLNEKSRLGIFSEIHDAYDALLDAQQGKVEVEVTVARALDDAELETVRQAVGQALNRHAVVRQSVDESIIGGLVLRVQDKLIDTSVRAQLAAIKTQMLAARPKAVG
jgi:F-type H+-transporting ATPase subunit delta